MLLVTGITGHSGNHFLQELINHNYDKPIRCIVRKNSVTTFLDKSGLKLEKVVGDLDDPIFMDNCMKGIETVLHIAGIQKTLSVIKSALKESVKRVIVVHTTGIFSNFKSASQDYKNIELEMKEMIKDHKINITILRPTMIYGSMKDLNMSKFIKMVDKFRVFPVINKGNGLIQPVNASDLGKAYYQLLTIKGTKSEYILSGEKPIPMLEAFKLISQNLGKKTFFVSFPLEIGVLMARALKLCTLGKVDYIEKVQRMGEDRSFPHEEAKGEFGFNPIPFSQGIKIEIAEYKSKKLNRSKGI